jgi:hypothetical protein
MWFSLLLWGLYPSLINQKNEGISKLPDFGQAKRREELEWPSLLIVNPACVMFIF